MNAKLEMASFVRLVVPGGAGDAMAPTDQLTLSQVSTKGGRLCPPNNTGTPGISDLPTALFVMYYQKTT